MKKISDVLKALILGIVLFGLLAQIVGIIIVREKLVYSLGLWIGVVISICMAVHMESSIDKGLDLGQGGAEKYVQKHSIIRYICVVLAFAAASYLNKNIIVPMFIGIMSLKVAAYIQPFTNKIILKIHDNKKETDVS